MKAAVICSAGGASVSGTATVDPAPVTDCPAAADPLASRQGPGVGACDHFDFVLVNKTVTIEPGVYCGGLSIQGSSNVTFNPGVYVIKDGRLALTGTSTMTGNGVGFYITGDALATVLTLQTHVSLSAPVSGPLAAGLQMHVPVKRDRGIDRTSHSERRKKHTVDRRPTLEQRFHEGGRRRGTTVRRYNIRNRIGFDRIVKTVRRIRHDGSFTRSRERVTAKAQQVRTRIEGRK